MFAAFDVNFNEELKSIWKTNKKTYQNAYLDKTSIKREKVQRKFLDNIKGDKINGEMVKSIWFPRQDNVDVFLSHSHEDIEDVRAFAGWLQEELELNVFIDADLWGDINKLEETLRPLLNKEVCTYKTKKIYDYGNSRKMFQHTNTMLSVALQQMIDESEALFFLNTDKSIQVHEENSMNGTYSPWIYTEIACSRIVRRKPLICYRDENKYVYNKSSKGTFYDILNEEYIPFRVVYPLNLEHMIKLAPRDFYYLSERKDQFSIKLLTTLDVLYEKKYKHGWDEFEDHLLLKKELIQNIRNMYE